MGAGEVIAIVAAGISFVAIWAGIGGVWIQVQRQWLLSSATTVTDFENRFVSEQWKEHRMNCALFVQAHHAGEQVSLSEDFQVLGMFEHMALLVRRRAIDLEMVWSKFGWYVVRYFEGLTEGPSNLIDDIRRLESDNTLWEEFEWLYHKVVSEYRKRGTPVGDSDVEQRISELLKQELTLLDYRHTRLAVHQNGRVQSPTRKSRAITARKVWQLIRRGA